MKGLNLRLACIFIILIFLLSPLSALDLNQDDNNKYINQEHDNSSYAGCANLSVDDLVNGTDADFEEYLVNGTETNLDEDLVNGTDADNAKRLGNATGINNNTKGPALLIDPNITAEVDDIVEGDDLVVKVHAEYYFQGPVHIICGDYSDDFKMWCGYGECTFKNVNLKPGTYSLLAFNFGDNRYMETYKFTHFKVWADSDLNLSIDDIYLGEKPVAEISANPNINGIAHIKLNNSDKSHDVKIENGHGSFTFDEDLPRGNYSATVSYEGDDTYFKDEATASFDVIDKHYNPHFTASIMDIPVDRRPILTIDMNESLNTSFYVKSDESLWKYEVPYKDSQIAYTIPEYFEAGKHTVLVGYENQSTHQMEEIEVYFNVKRYDLDFRPHVGDVFVGENPVVEINTDKSFTAKVLISSPDLSRDYEANAVNGSLRFAIPEELKAGNHTVKVVFEGNEEFNPYETEARFSVNKYDLNLSAEIDDIELDQKPVIKVNADEKFSGNVFITAPGFKHAYRKEMTNGSLVLTLNENLHAGNYTVDISFEGNGTFNKDQTTASFAVNRFSPDLSIDVDDLDLGEEADFKINACKNLTGNVKLELLDSHNAYTVPVVDGKANKTIKSLMGGNQRVKVSFNGNDIIYPGEAYANFTVRDNRTDPNLSVHVDDINRGDSPTIEIHANDTFNGIILVSSPSYMISYPVQVNDGYLKYQLSERLKEGNYTIRVSYPGNDTFKQVETSASFEVHENRNASDLSLHVKSIHPGEKAIVEVHANDSINGMVKVKLNDSNETCSINLVKGYGKTEFDNLDFGSYLVTASFDGNSEFLPDEVNATFKVVGYENPRIKVFADDIVYGEEAEVEIYTNRSFSGEVSVELNDSTIVNDVKVVYGIGKAKINNLSAGKYTVTVRYAGDNDFCEDENSTQFTVEKIQPDLSVNVDDNYCGEDTVVEIHANESFNCDVDLELNDTATHNKVRLVNGYGKAEISNLTPGEYIATVRFAGDENFTEDEACDGFAVKKYDTNLSVHVDDVAYGQKPTIEIKANPSLNACVQIRLDSATKLYTVKLENGYAQMTLEENLNPGIHSVKALLYAHYGFKDDMAEDSFNVFAIGDPNLSVSVDDIDYHEDAIVEIRANKTLNGNVTVQLDDKDSLQTVKLVNGYGKTEISNLDAGEYSVTVRYDGAGMFKAAEDSTEFTVEKISPNLRMQIDDVQEHQRPIAEIHADESLNGDVLLTCSDFKHNYQATIRDGFYLLDIDESMHPGTYTVKAIFKGNENFKSEEIVCTFKVIGNDSDEKINSSLEMNDVESSKKKVANSSLDGVSKSDNDNTSVDVIDDDSKVNGGDSSSDSVDDDSKVNGGDSSSDSVDENDSKKRIAIHPLSQRPIFLIS